MTDFRRLSDTIWASPQISTAELAEAAAQGFTMVVNNRPDGESDDQPDGAAIQQAATELGLGYASIPVDHSGFSEPQVAAMAQALERADGKVLAYCRSGTRSTFLWALAEASRGKDPAALAQAAHEAGYDISPAAPMLDMLASRDRG